ncbi:hypothetical protein [Spirosoma agri]|uniref:Lipocalin-like domain-containing protein n=1 Tax=Spirosoma agri TaxID=1987381 RepID=A0A6M0IMJ7_9BACT|nr:hypothetical protein [Spirosoma agri]NEU68133.1 hypothetical protein [Spirosoma agri]
MKQQLLFIFFGLFFIGFISACSKESEVPVASGPIVGQWDINRYVVSNLPASYSTLNGTINSNLGTDTYTFRIDSTYSESYSSSNGNAKGTEEGMWSLRDSVLIMRPLTSSSQVPAPYILKYVSANGEISTGPRQTSGSVTNPTTRVTETVSYSLEFFYRKRY